MTNSNEKLTTEETIKIQKTIQRLVSSLDILNERMEKFQKDFAVNPVYALEWSKSTFKDAAAQSLFRWAVTQLREGNYSIDVMIQEHERKIFDSARNIVNISTSQTANLMDHSKIEASVELLRILGSRI